MQVLNLLIVSHTNLPNVVTVLVVEGIDGKQHLTLFIENGRILDFPGKPLKTGLAEIAKIHKGDFRMTANQNLVVAGVPTEDKEKIEALAVEFGLKDASVSNQRLNSMACVCISYLSFSNGGSRTLFTRFSYRSRRYFS